MQRIHETVAPTMNGQPRQTPDQDPGSGPSIRLLGGVTATDADDRPVDIGPAKCKALLAALALSPGAAVPVSRLVELIWGHEPPRTADKTLQSYATQLRKSLGSDRVVRVGAAYRLDVPARAVDVSRFELELEAGNVGAALAEWTGPPLAGLDLGGLGPAAAGLIEKWLGAVEAELEQHVESDPAGTIGQLTELTADHPMREGLWALLMTALYATNRQAEALSAYRRARNHLVEELGVEPGPRLQQLEAKILAHDERLPAAPDRSGPLGQLPSGTVTFGYCDIEDITGLWASNRAEATAAVSRHEQIVTDLAVANDGRVFSVENQACGVAFNRVDDAARWAVAVQAAIEAERWPGLGVRVRIGLNTGDAERGGGRYIGPAVALAARIAAVGHGGQILASTATAALLTGHQIHELGSVGIDDGSVEQAVVQIGNGRFPPLPAVIRAADTLPSPQASLLGRDDLLESIGSLLSTASVVTLVGPGGIGKTRLALEAARIAAADRDGGAWLVELADVTSPDDVVRAVADALDMKELRGRSLLESVVLAVRTRRALLVLDNCEHVVDGAAELVAAITDSTDGEDHAVQILATSREGLGLQTEQLVAVGPLDPTGAAVELFKQRAGNIDQTFDPDAHHRAVTEICRRLDGVPLAIELAAARIRTLTPDDLVQRLDRSFRILTGGRRRTVERHRTIRATIQWSHELLTEPEQVLFRRLSIFAGSFDLAAAEAVTADADLPRFEVGELLADLVERSMVLVESGALGRRFRLLEIMRQFGAEQLAEHDDPDRLAADHAAHVVLETSRIGDLLSGQGELEGAARLTDLWPNLRAAVEWAEATDDLELGLRIVGPVAPQTMARRGVGEITDWLVRLLAMADPDDDDTISLLLLWISMHYVMTHDREAFARIVDRYGQPDHALATAAAVIVADDDNAMLDLIPALRAELVRRGELYLNNLMGVFEAGALLGQGRLDEAAALLNEKAERFRVEGPPTFLNWTLFMMAATADLGGDSKRAESLYAEAVNVVLPPHTNSPNEVLRARTMFRNGRHIEAFTGLRDYIDELVGVDNLSAAGMVAIDFVNMMTASDRLIMAARVLGYLDRSGILDVEGPGFRVMLTDSSAVVDADESAVTTRRAAAAENIDDRAVMVMIRNMLDDLVSSAGDGPNRPATVSRPGADR